jgi:hypothetical protein
MGELDDLAAARAERHALRAGHGCLDSLGYRDLELVLGAIGERLLCRPVRRGDEGGV